MEVQWPFGDMRDMGTWGTHGGPMVAAMWVPRAISHQSAGDTSPLHWHCPVLSESPRASPAPGLVPHLSGHCPLFTSTWAQG